MKTQWFNRLKLFFKRLYSGGGAGEFLCDTCRYDYGSACTRPERPNARKCPDYKSN